MSCRLEDLERLTNEVTVLENHSLYCMCYRRSSNRETRDLWADKARAGLACSPGLDPSTHEQVISIFRFFWWISISAYHREQRAD